MQIEFLSQGPALVIENTQRVLVIADLHFGIESDFERKGVHIPSQTHKRFQRALACIDEARADLLLLLGDVKHNVPLTSRQEFREMPAIMEAFRARIPLKVAPGNHDGGLERFLQEGELLPRRGAAIDGVWYLHGHTYPDPACAGSLLVVGHHHPMVSLYDEVGCALHDRAYLLGAVDGACLHLDPSREGTRALFVPSFNELSGFDLLQLKNSSLGPLTKCMKLDDAEVYLTDGTFVGTVAAIESSRP
jgi:putative SbcD/Mre11-related phosphoesterase